MHFTVAIIRTKIYNFQDYDEKNGNLYAKSKQMISDPNHMDSDDRFCSHFFYRICTAYRFTFFVCGKINAWLYLFTCVFNCRLNIC